MSSSYDTVTALNIFPVKSAQAATVEGEMPEKLSVGITGFVAEQVRDREFVIVEAEAGPDGSNLFVSQRGWDADQKAVHKTDSTLARLEINITSEYLEFYHPEAGDYAIPSTYDASGIRYSVRVHGSYLRCAIDQGSGVAAYLTRILNRPVRLARNNLTYPRLLPEKFWQFDASNQTAGSDSFPFLLVNQTSLDASNSVAGLTADLAQVPVPLSAFRGNIEIDGETLGPYGEDYVRQMRIGMLSAYVVKASSRCPVPTIDQITGQHNAYPALKILRNHRGKLADDSRAEPLFGQNLNHIYRDSQYVAIGDPIEISATAGVRNFTEV